MATTSTERRADAEEERSFVEPRNERVPVFVSVVLLVVLGVIAADIVIMDGWGDAIPMFVLFAIVLTMLLAVGPFEQQSAGIRRHVAAGSWLLPPIGFVAVILVLGEQDDQDDFFGAAAEVLPVLALALAIEATALHEQLKTDPIGRVIALSTFALIAYGEFEALEGLADGETTGRDAEIVWGALAAGALGIVLVAFRPRSKTDTSGGNDGNTPWRPRYAHAPMSVPYFDQSGGPSDAPPRFVRVEDLDPLVVIPGLEFRPVTTDSVMTNFVRFEPDAVAPAHHHAEQQIAIILSGELELTVGGETRVMHAGDCVVIPPNVEHEGVAGPQGCEALDVFTPPRAGIVRLMAE